MENQFKATGIMISRAKFENDYSIIDKEGVIKGIKASGQNNPWYNENLGNVNDDYDRTILVNLKAIEARKVASVLALFEGREEIDLGELSKLTYVHQINLNKDQETPRLPIRDQEVTLQFYYATDKEGNEVADMNGEQIFNSAQLQVPEPIAAKKFDFSSLNVNVKAEERLQVEFK